jgi:hypothetical protein
MTPHTSPALESLANAAIGFVVSWAATVFVLGYSPAHSIAVVGMFFILSFVRSYAIRLLFMRLSND